VDAEIHRAALRLVDARIPTFVPLLLRRHAAHGLRERLEGSARLPDQPVRVTSRPGREDGEPPHSVYT
jgi:hypothetical protein